MSRNVVDAPVPNGWPGYCTGCSVCSAVCPTSAISIELNADGFYEPVVTELQCTACGACIKVCHRAHPAQKIEREPLVSYSAKHLDSRVLRHSSSGGVSPELMKACLQRGYAVVGVAYDAQERRAVARVATSPDELDQFAGSKYFQSLNAEAYRSVMADRSAQKYAVFGTPCQIYGLSRAAEFKRKRNRFLLIDLFCHGCPSVNLWTEYIASVESEAGQRFDQIEFRSKVHGWHEFAFRFASRDTVLLSRRLEDPFYTLFFSKNAFCRACYDCAARSTLAYTDIRLGDFWGSRYDTDTQGVSAVAVVTEAGVEALSWIEQSFEVEHVCFDEMIRAQSYGKDHSLDNVARQRLLSALSSETSLDVLVKEELRLESPRLKLRRIVKRILNGLPRGAFLALRKRAHQIGEL